MRVGFTDHLRGRTVLDAGGQVVGTLDELIVDTETLELAGIRLRLKREVAREIGASAGLFHGAMLELPMEMVSAAGDAVILSVPLARLHELAAGSDKRPPEPAPPAPEPAGPA
jgi:sporulation protein YlmC with PRC-barrel domain